MHGRSRGRERENFNKRVGGFRPLYAAGATHAKSEEEGTAGERDEGESFWIVFSMSFFLLFFSFLKTRTV